MDNAARTRQRVLAVFLPITAVLYISGEAVSPKGTDALATDTASALKLLAVAAKYPAQLYAAGGLVLVALACLAVSYAAITTLVRNRGAALATVAALLGGLGALSGVVTNGLAYPNLAAAATAHLAPAAAAQFMVTSSNSAFAHVFTYFYAGSEYLAPVLMGLALWLSRSVPRWLAVLFVIGVEIASSQGSSGIIVILWMLPFAAALILLAARIWQAAALPASEPQKELAGMPV
ncbi:MAG TPA: hypothetical protein VG142_01920 [Trebonia sp.]|jgi:hypothetical protein|nr:hypothetical protein [Trebonia sp.]